MYWAEENYHATVLLYIHVRLFEASAGFYVFQLAYLTFHKLEDP
jgi:hypothetical protein